MNALKIAAALCGLALVALLWSAMPEVSGAARFEPNPGGFAFRAVRVFDGERFLAPTTVLVKDGRIAAIGRDLAVPAGMRVVAGEGLTLLPGLIDAHVHTWGEARRDALRFGVTTMIDMFSDPAGLPAARRERAVLAATTQADLWSAGYLATAAGGHGSQFGLPVPTLAGAAEAEAWVAARKREGSDFIKLVREDLHVYSAKQRLPTLAATTAAAVITAAHAQGMRAVVHASARAAAQESLRDGADGLVHVFQDELADAGLVALARKRGAFVIPTLSVIANFAGAERTLAADPRIRPWLSAAQRESLDARMRYDAGTPELLQRAVENVRRLHAAGVPILAGTDAPNPGTAHGASLHEELRLLATAGLDAASVLAAATARVADGFGLADRGRIRAGLRADLVLVRGDPATDLAASRDIVGIWKNGQPVPRDPADVEALAPSPGLVSDFDDEALASRFGSGWVATSDRMAGGQSEAMLARIEGGAAGSAGALQVSGELQAGEGQRWAGAFFNPGAQMMQAVDARGWRELVFQLRGDGRELQVLLFSGEQGTPPARLRVRSTPQWQLLRLPLAQFAGLDAGRVRALAITAQAPSGRFEFALDQVEIR